MFDLTPILEGQPWREWSASPVSGDASARQYARLTGPDGSSVIVMHSGPVPTDAFVNIAMYLSDIGLSAPQILHHQPPYIVMTDLGRQDLATALDQADRPEKMRAAVGWVLHSLFKAVQPVLPSPTTADLGDAVRITAEYFAPDTDADQLAQLTADALTRLTAYLPRKIALRDFHAKNIIWRPTEHGLSRVGLLDFQDAVMMPAGYDLVSFIRDVRRPMSDNAAEDLTRQFCADTGLDQTTFLPAAAAIGAQRNLRILGVFQRLITEMGKPGYARFLPNTWTLLKKDLAHPDLKDLHDYVQATFPKAPA